MGMNVFKPGERVRIRKREGVEPTIPGIVEAVKIDHVNMPVRGGASHRMYAAEYLVTWWDRKTRQTQWLKHTEVESSLDDGGTETITLEF